MSRSINRRFSLCIGILLGVLGMGLAIRELMQPAEPVYQGKPAMFWVCDLQSPRDKAAVEAIRQIGADGLPLYLAMLQTKDAPLKDRLVGWGHRLSPSFSQMLRRFHWDFAERSRERARRIFEILGPVASPAIPKLLAVLQKEAGGKNRNVAEEAACALRCIGPEGLSVLVQTLTNNNEAVRCLAAEVMTTSGLDGTPAIPSLINCLRDTSDRVRSFALQAIESITQRLRDEGLDNRSLEEAIVPALMERLLDRNAGIRASAAFGLGAIRSKTALPALLLALEDPDYNVRFRSCQALCGIKGEAVVVVPALIQALNDPESQVRCHAADALAIYGAEAEAAFDRLMALQNATNEVERNCVSRALKQINPKGAE